MRQRCEEVGRKKALLQSEDMGVGNILYRPRSLFWFWLFLCEEQIHIGTNTIKEGIRITLAGMASVCDYRSSPWALMRCLSAIVLHDVAAGPFTAERFGEVFLGTLLREKCADALMDKHSVPKSDF